MIYNLFNKKFSFKRIKPNLILNNQNGVSAIIVAIVLAMLFCFTALAVDVGYMYATRNELQDVADAAALAATSELGRIYLTLPQASHTNYNFSIDQQTVIKNAAINIAKENEAAKIPIDIASDDIVIGTWDWDETNLMNALTPTLVGSDAVRVRARRDSVINSPVATFFGKMFSLFGASHDTFESFTIATAALSGPSVIGEGELVMPIGISDIWMLEDEDFCKEIIDFSPTNTSCAGWHNFKDPINASVLADRFFGFIEAYEGDSKTEGKDWLNTYFSFNKDVVVATMPEYNLPTDFEFQGGTIASLFTGTYYGTYNADGIPDQTTASKKLDKDGKLPGPIPFYTLFDFFRFRDNDEDINSEWGCASTQTFFCGDCVDADLIWTSTVPVYEESLPCENPNQTQKIIKVATIKVRMPNGPPDNNIEVCIDCGTIVADGRGGGGTGTNIKGNIPNLVQ
ncbi:pilus assembly protein TadG-related protein [Desulfobacula toluolica]|uniref:Putative Flp pilus-assembly TadG-like N-terminal domain-containing protein n=1 Tax=Desulfobacula toluolica (strain DSM 7467 / Tol2) TaxID=651182 RepID=K0NNT8_DESTT|nr:Tad domain-containing protein [Desulfobacula toluolica]CCK80432.1 uncharacterized protein TOL2_C22710 [Desulfobacula toluolica Tol2]